MRTYLDASVVLRVLLGQRDRLAEWDAIRNGVASALVEVECLRTLDRIRLREGASQEDWAPRREAFFRILEAIDLVRVTRPILLRASQPFPAPLGTLDAIHLATAMTLQEQGGEELLLATHDEALALAARSAGLRVIGARPTDSTGPDTSRLGEGEPAATFLRGTSRRQSPRRRPGIRRRAAATGARRASRTGA
ncbi:MAG: PIN domain-containing protein [Planctomycetes bacterium]|nr:PIN domain-containing protein [Planctomycetota bacterium]